MAWIPRVNIYNEKFYGLKQRSTPLRTFLLWLPLLLFLTTLMARLH
jgi:hypothetical protein